MATTPDSLFAAYASPIAHSAGIDPADYDRTPDGLASLLRDTAEDMAPTDQTRQWLQDAAADLDAIARLGDDGAKTQELLDRIDATLYEAKRDLA
jgi:hypothetical protein